MDNVKEKNKLQSVMTQFFPSTPNEAHLLQTNTSLFAENTARTQNENVMNVMDT